MDIKTWVFGPQLIGIIMFITGCVLYRFPPKRINDLYGYRSSLSKKNQQTWFEANRYAAIYMIKMSLIIIVVGIIITAVLNAITMPAKLKEGLSALIFILSPLSCLMVLVSTEKHLKKKFDPK